MVERVLREVRKRVLTVLLGLALIAGLTGVAVGYVGAKVNVRGTLASLKVTLLAEPKVQGKLDWQRNQTGLVGIEQASIQIPNFESPGGGLLEIDDGLLVVDGYGAMFHVRPGEDPAQLPFRAPINIDEFKAHPVWQQPNLLRKLFRVSGTLARESKAGGFEIFISHHFLVGDCVESRVSVGRIGFVDNRPELLDPWRTLFRARPCVPFRPAGDHHAFMGDHSGGGLAWAPDGTLLLSLGDHGLFGLNGYAEKTSMDPTTDLGKVLRLNAETGEATIVSTGLRNPRGLLLDSAGRTWVNDNGPQGGDELNLVKDGANFGWPEDTLGVEYGDRLWPFNPSQGRHIRFQKPAFAWTPAIAPTAMVEAPSGEFPEWKNDILVATLRDRALHRLRLNGETVLYDEPIYFPNMRIQDLKVMRDQRIVFLTDDGEVVLVRRATDASLDQASEKPSVPPPIVKGKEAGRDVFLANCASCHRLDLVNAQGPYLNGLIGRHVGGQESFSYTPALHFRGAKWTEDRLAQYLMDPQAMYPGTQMSASGLSRAQVNAVVSYLSRVK